MNQLYGFNSQNTMKALCYLLPNGSANQDFPHKYAVGVGTVISKRITEFETITGIQAPGRGKLRECPGFQEQFAVLPLSCDRKNMFQHG